MTQESNSSVSNEKLAHRIFTFEWENILRIVGVITGITGIAAALLYVLGYIRVVRSLSSLGVSQSHYLLSFPNEFYLLNGVSPLSLFLANSAGLVISYILARQILQAIAYGILGKIKRPLISLGVGVTLVAILIYIGFSINPNFVDLLEAAPYVVVFTIAGIDMLVVIYEAIYIKDTRRESLTRYYNLTTSMFSVVKVVIFGFILYFMLFNTPYGGDSFSCLYLTESPISVTMYSDNSLGLEGESESADTYIYEGYYLLYTDDNNYFFFKELDPENLKPKSIIIVKKDAIDAIQLEENKEPPNWNLTKTCSDLYGN